MDSASSCKIQHIKPLCQTQLLCTVIPTCHTAVLLIAKVAVSIRREAVASIRPYNPCNNWMQDTLKKLVCVFKREVHLFQKTEENTVKEGNDTLRVMIVKNVYHRELSG